MSKFYNPVSIFFDHGALDKLPEIIKKYGKKVLMLSGKSSLHGNIPFQNILSKLEPHISKNITGVSSNPDIEDIFKTLSEIKDEKFSAILAVGGGSVIDSAKAISAFHNCKVSSVSDLRSRMEEGKYAKDRLPIIAVATTAGTGSETDQWATIWDRANKGRIAIGDDKTFPAESVVEPALTLTMPPRLTVTAALDTLCHAVEGIWANNANSISRTFALKSAILVFKNLESAIKCPENICYREALSRASCLAGISLSVSKTTVCHAISYPLTLDYNIEHGIACALTLADVYQYNKGSIPDEQDLDEVIAKGIGKQPLANYIKNICNLVDIPTKLADFGVKREDLPELAKRSMLAPSLNNNPKPISEEKILNILRLIY